MRHLNLCASCGHDFASVGAFDMHRVGKHAYLASPEQPDGRRCLDAAEMEAKQMRRGQDGRWRGPASQSPWFASAAA